MNIVLEVLSHTLIAMQLSLLHIFLSGIYLVQNMLYAAEYGF